MYALFERTARITQAYLGYSFISSESNWLETLPLYYSDIQHCNEISKAGITKREEIDSLHRLEGWMSDQNEIKAFNIRTIGKLTL